MSGPESTTDIEIEQLIEENNCDAISRMLEEVDMYEYAVNETTSTNHIVATLVLNFASACAFRDTLSPELAKTIIARTASSVDIFKFLRTLVIYCDIDVSQYDDYELPDELIYDLKNNNMNGSVTERILALDEDEFFGLATLIIGGKIKELDMGFSIPVVHYVYYRQVVPLDTMLAYMATNLNQPSVTFLEELSRDLFGMFF